MVISPRCLILLTGMVQGPQKASKLNTEPKNWTVMYMEVAKSKSMQ